MIKNLEILFLRGDFQREVEKIREKWDIPKDSYLKELENSTFEDFEAGKFYPEKLEVLWKNQDFVRDIQKLCAVKEFNISNKISKQVGDYVLLGNIGRDEDFFEALFEKTRVIYQEGGDGWDSRLFIEVFADTTIEDIQDVWVKEVKKYQKSLRGFEEGRYTLPGNFFRDLTIYKLKQRGDLSNREIAAQVNKKFGYKASNKRYVMDYNISGIVAYFKESYIPK